MYDIVIIGAGIVGTMLAKDLSKYQLKIAILEKENDIADGATMANSAIVHTGYDPEEGTLKARLNVLGARLYPQLCKDLNCAYKTVGAYVVASGSEEEANQEILAKRAEDRGIPYEWISGEEARKEEPNLSEEITRALVFPTTAIIYPWEVAIACAQVAVTNGVELKLNTECTGITKTDTGYFIHTNGEDYETRMIINASGIHADEIYGMVGTPTFHMTPRRGEYFVIDSSVNYVNHIIFPVPSSKGKGVLAVPTVYGNTLIGPNSDYVSGTVDTGDSFQGLDYVRNEIQKTMRNVPLNYSIRNFAGLRPSSSCSDFIIEEAVDARNFINVASIESPGLASSPGISKYVIDMLVRPRLNLIENPNAVMTRPAPLVMQKLNDAERAEAIARNPQYGKMICRCEQISEGEIVDCIHAVCGARSVKGVKKRVRPGMGRCQGGFCEPRVVEILARELKIRPLDVVLDGLKSTILEGENR